MAVLIAEVVLFLTDTIMWMILFKKKASEGKYVMRDEEEAETVLLYIHVSMLKLVSSQIVTTFLPRLMTQTTKL